MHAKDEHDLADRLSRRTALKAFSAGALLAMGTACTRKPERRIVSLADQPEYQTPGTELWYASTFSDGPGSWPYGIKVKSVDGRPVKIEGLDGHPLNDGRSNAFMQASLLSLYDPTRLRSPRKGGEELTWDAADEQIVAALRAAASVVVITGSTLGPSERALVERFCAVKEGAKHVVWESVSDRARRLAWREIYGADGVVHPRLDRASVILSLGSDFLGTDGETLGAARAFSARRVVDGDPKASKLSRLYVAEGAMTTTGSNADHRIPLKPSATPALAAALKEALGGDLGTLEALAKAHHLDAKVLEALVTDLQGATGEAVVLAGPHLPPAVHGIVAELNQQLKAPLAWLPEPPALLSDAPETLSAALAQKPDVVLCLGVNPVYDFPAPRDSFGAAFDAAKLVVGHGLTANESLEASEIQLPSAHDLESWNDAAPLSGITSFCQPLIAPLYGGRQEAHSLLVWAKAMAPEDAAWKDAADFRDFVQSRFAGDEAAWEDALRKGWVGTRVRHPLPSVKAGGLAKLPKAPATTGEGNFELVLLPHPTVYDGRFAGNEWLQELPDPVSRLVWDNAAQLGPKTARALGVDEGDWVTVSVGERSLDLPVLVQTGTAPNVVVVALGQGRLAGAGAGDGVGVRVAPLVGIDSDFYWAPAKVTKANGQAKHQLVRSQIAFGQKDRFNDEPRPIALSGSADEYRHDAAFAKHLQHHVDLDQQLHPDWDYSQGHKWEMAVDLSACIGCGACTVACQAENNIPSVGKEECGRGREMSWMRIDRYEAGDPENPEVIQQPMLCQHCDNAPCENVCPVNATAHSPEGLNEQVYNRCVGTRYCANNCPYKVRRFNYFAYTKNAIQEAEQELLHNPQVTVRMRGIMEKCSFCVQRINAVKFAASNAGVEPAPDAVVPACQQACPASAIVFGDLNREGSTLKAKANSPLGYKVLEELNARPAITYLAKVRNPAPGTAPPKEHGDGHGSSNSHENEGGHR